MNTYAHRVAPVVMVAAGVFALFLSASVVHAATVEIKLNCSGQCTQTPPQGRTCVAAQDTFGEGAPRIGGSGPDSYRTSITETQVCDGQTKQVRYAVFNVGAEVGGGGGGDGGGMLQQLLQPLTSALGQAIGQSAGKGLEGLNAGQSTCGLTDAAVKASSEGDPKNCSLVVAGPGGCPVIVKVAKDPFKPCPDAWASFGGGAGGSSQLSQIAGQAISGIFQGLIQGLMGGGGGGGGAGAGAYQEPSTYDSTLSGEYSTSDLLGQNDDSVLDSLRDASSNTGTDTVGEMQQAGNSAVRQAANQTQSVVNQQTATDMAPGVFEKFCSNRSWENGAVSWLLPSSVFERMCATLNRATTRTQTTSSFTNSGNTTSSTESGPIVRGEEKSGRGITCPAYLRENQRAQISWSCGNAALSAVAGFTLGDAKKTSAVVRPEGESGVYGVRCSDGFESLCTIQVINPQIIIQAVPNEVRLGSRTMIYWSAQGGVESCDILGPSFSEHSLKGGAATVPINERSTFTIQCKLLDGTTETRKVSVGLSI